MELWLWTLEHLQNATDGDGRKLYHGNRQGVTFPLADAVCWLLAARQLILDVLELEAQGPQNPTVAEALPGLLRFYTDLAHTQVARAAGEVGRICAELVYGYNRPAASDTANLEEFVRQHAKLDASLAGSRLAKDRAAEALTHVMIPEALDYPV